MAILISRLDGISPDVDARLRACKIRDSNDLLRACRTPAERDALAHRVTVDPTVINTLAHQADLARIRGVGTVYIHLLEKVGVKTIEELAAREPEELRADLLAANTEHKLAGRMPTLAMINGWITKARKLPRMLEG